MPLPSTTKKAIYKVLFNSNLKNSLTAKEYSLATSDAGLDILEMMSSGDGSTAGLTAYIALIKSNPIAFEYLTTSDISSKFQNVIGNISFTTASASDPTTYTTLHNELKANEPKLDGLIALRDLAVDPTINDDGPNLGAGGSGNALSDAYVIGLYATWGAAKFNAIFNHGVLKSIINESNASYDTLAEVAAVYSAWANAVPVTTFFSTIDTMVSEGVTGLKFSEMITLANNQTNFNKYTSHAAITLMASSGGSFSNITGLSANEFAALTSTNAIRAIEESDATYTLLHTVYGASTDKLNSLLSKNAVDLASKGYTNLAFSNLSTNYGTTYTLAKKAEFDAIIDAENHTLFADGATYASISALYAAGKVHSIDTETHKILVDNDPSNFAADLTTLSATLVDYSGFEAFTDGGFS